MSGEKPVEQVVADWRERASALKIAGHRHDAELVEKVLDDVTRAMPEYLAYLTETEAMLYEGRKTPDALRQRFTEFVARDLAKWEGRRRMYRRIALRHRGNPEAAKEAGRRAARGYAA